MVESKLYKEAVEIFGKENQLRVTIGELAECSADLSRVLDVRREFDENLAIREIADVCIMMKQMEVIYGEKLTEAIHSKLDKLKSHIKKERQTEKDLHVR